MNQYTLKVYPASSGRTAYRVIEISGNDTLDKLCETILFAFDFVHEHMYEFCMDNRMYSQNSYQSFPERKGERSTMVTIDSLRLVKGQKYSLHYDFGDDWMFSINVQKISEVNVRSDPKITKSVGMVEQYPDSDEENDEDDDEGSGDFDIFEDDEEEEAEYEESRKKNKKYIDIFEKDLKAAGLSPKTIDNHIGNIDLYLNDYLQYEDNNDMTDGVSYEHISDFFGYFYIRKCMWSTPGNLKTTAASIKKFYKCMSENGFIGVDEYKELSSDLKENVARWQEECRKYNDDEEDDYSDWF